MPKNWLQQCYFQLLELAVWCNYIITTTEIKVIDWMEFGEMGKKGERIKKLQIGC